MQHKVLISAMIIFQWISVFLLEIVNIKITSVHN